MIKLIVGLTGGIASGKSEASKQFSRLGVDIIDADQVVRNLQGHGQPAYQAIFDKLGSDILLADGNINRKKLRQYISEDDELRKWLENCLHPLVRQEMAQWVKTTTSPYCILVIPLLVENLPNPLINRILVIDADPKQQQQQAMKRDQMDQQHITAMIAAQASRQQRLNHADDVIDNNGKLENLKQQVKQKHQKYLQLSQAMSV